MPADSMEVLIEQFDRTAEDFDGWPVTHDEKMLGGLAAFCGLGPDDDVLDVACGTGAFALFAARTARSVTGVDASAGMLAVARRTAVAREHRNIEFIEGNVERLEFGDGGYSLVVSRSAFHHMPHHEDVFAEMVRCTRAGGRVCVQDIMSYDEASVDAFFEQIEVIIDQSHHRALGKRAFFDLFRNSGVAIDILFASESVLDFDDYVGHAGRDDLVRSRIDALLAKGMADPVIAPWFVERDGRLCWRRKVCTITGITAL